LADFGRQHPFGARRCAQRIPDATLGPANPVEGRGVDIAHPGFPGGADNFLSGRASDIDLAAAERGAAEAEFGHPHPGTPNLSPPKLGHPAWPLS